MLHILVFILIVAVLSCCIVSFCLPFRTTNGNNTRSVVLYTFSPSRGRENYLDIKKWEQSTLIHANRHTILAYHRSFSRFYSQDEDITLR